MNPTTDVLKKRIAQLEGGVAGWQLHLTVSHSNSNTKYSKKWR